MIWSEVGAVESKATANGFLDALEIWRKKPHVVNRRLCGAQLLWSDSTVSSGGLTLDECIGRLKPLRDVFRSTESKPKDLEEVVFSVKETLESIACGEADNGGCRWDLTVRCLIPKQKLKIYKVLEVVVINRLIPEGVFLPICATEGESNSPMAACDFAYKVSLDQSLGKVFLYLIDGCETSEGSLGESHSIRWLRDVLLTKLARWSEETKLNTEITSLRLVCVERYNEVYNELKDKYGRHLVANWPEQTDPSKFVYEDIGIAAYLLVLWEMERKTKGLTKRQSFVDIGCGNGLLVYLLASEGHSGFGIDIRRRKIWDLLSSVADLREGVVLPSDNSVFPNHDWLIGNHSDELTPWIPVIASRSHYDCRYFVLPCCAWDFGDKFSSNGRGGQGTSQYHSYLEFVKEVGDICGFKVQRDTLRIPSTKRVCFVGTDRSYPMIEEALMDRSRQDYIDDRCRRTGPRKRICFNDHVTCELEHSNQGAQKHSCNAVSIQNLDRAGDLQSGSIPCDLEERSDCSESVDCIQSKNICRSNGQASLDEHPGTGCGADASVWLARFEPRSSVEKPRNAVCIEQSVKTAIAVTVLERILQTTDTITLQNGKAWNKGGTVSLNEASQLFDRETLLRLKNECGGLQSLLKNCPDVFIVLEGHVGLRDWTSDDYVRYRESRIKKRPDSAVKAQGRRKTKMCFFFEHHPNSCPLDRDSCRFAHGADDLKN